MSAAAQTALKVSSECLRCIIYTFVDIHKKHTCVDYVHAQTYRKTSCLVVSGSSEGTLTVSSECPDLPQETNHYSRSMHMYEVCEKLGVQLRQRDKASDTASLTRDVIGFVIYCNQTALHNKIKLILQNSKFTAVCALVQWARYSGCQSVCTCM